MAVSDNEASLDPAGIQHLKPVNLNPSKLGPTLTKILQGKCSMQNIDSKGITVSLRSESAEASQKTPTQENNLESKIES